MVIRDPIAATGQYDVIDTTVRINGALLVTNQSSSLLENDGVVVVPVLLPGETLHVTYVGRLGAFLVAGAEV